MNDTDDFGIIIEVDGPVLIIMFLLVCLICISWQVAGNARQRRKLAVVEGPNQQMRQNRRMFFYTILIVGLLTLLANYIMGVTSSLAASHLIEAQDPTSLLSLPGVPATMITIGLYAVGILATAAVLQKKERLGFPELLADLNNARKFGGLENARQIAHYQGELERLQQRHQGDRPRAYSGTDFDHEFTAHESEDRPGLLQQLAYLRHEPRHRARARSFRRTVFLNYRTLAGKWIAPFALLAAMSLSFAAGEFMAANDGDHSLAVAWAMAALLGAAAVAGQYFCDVGRALLESRREYISQQTRQACRLILAEAEAEAEGDPAAAKAGARADPAAPAACDCWEPVLRIGRWETHRRRKP